MPYYTLITKTADGLWAPQFGDYYRGVVKEEMTYYKESYGYKSQDIKILKTQTARQKEILNLIETMNNKPTEEGNDTNVRR